jgi:hypothetical protein
MRPYDLDAQAETCCEKSQLGIFVELRVRYSLWWTPFKRMQDRSHGYTAQYTVSLMGALWPREGSVQNVRRWGKFSTSTKSCLSAESFAQEQRITLHITS